MTNTDSQPQPDTGMHGTSEVTTQEYADGGLLADEAHTWTPAPYGEAGCTLTLPAPSPGEAERLRGVLKHVDLDWLMTRHLMLPGRA